jgi:hypothetical protein
LRAVIEHAEYPIVLRFDAGHWQRSMFVCGSKESALRALPKVRFPAAVLRFINTRASWRLQEPGSLMARYFHKKRTMVFPSAVINNHLYFSTVAVVGSRTSTFKSAVDGEPPQDIDEMIEADIRYSLSPPEHPDLMQAAVRALGLDSAAIDYSCFADGRVVLWEANPYFALPHWSQAMLPRRRRLAERNPRYVKAMIDDIARFTGMVSA